MNPPASDRVVACGVTGAGKSHALRALFLSRCDRALILDPLGEHATSAPAGTKVYQAHDVAGVLQAMKQAPRHGTRWRIVANIDPRDAVRLVPVLIFVWRIAA